MQTIAKPWDVKLLYDGECPLCVREVRFMSWLNKNGRLALEDIASPGFDAAQYGRTFEQLMGHIHAVLPDGRLVTGMEAFRRSYKAVGLGFLLAPTGWPLLRPLFDKAYEWFARNRLRFTGRGDACDTGRCALPDKPVAATPAIPAVVKTHLNGASSNGSSARSVLSIK